MARKHKTTPVKNREEIRQFFQAAARDYREQHGEAARLLAYRLKLLCEAAQFRKTDNVLEIGCGPGDHLIALSGQFGRGIGVDFSLNMIQRAREKFRTVAPQVQLEFQVDDATELDSLKDGSVDVALMIGVLEHIPQPEKALRQVYRVLKPQGRLVILTPNGNYIWYKHLAPLLRIETRHLSTDRFFTKSQLKVMLQRNGFESIRIDAWTFIPRGDMPKILANLLELVDFKGRLFHLNFLRGGLRVFAEKPGKN